VIPFKDFRTLVPWQAKKLSCTGKCRAG
jgi:hypothetical protein